MPRTRADGTKTQIVVVGGGAGGLELVTKIGAHFSRQDFDIILVDRNPTHIWKPLLHEVAAGSLNSSEDELNYVAQAKWNHFEFQLGRMSGLDREQKKIQLAATLDGRTAAADGTSQWITGAQTREFIHRLRADNDLIAVGTGTVIADNPSLTARDAAGQLP